MAGKSCGSIPPGAFVGSHEHRPSHLAPAEERAKIVEENRRLEAKRANEAAGKAASAALSAAHEAAKEGASTQRPFRRSTTIATEPQVLCPGHRKS